MHLPNVKLYHVEQLHACCPIQPTAYAVTCYVVCVLVVFMQASGDAAGGKQGSSIANALDDSTPQQVGGSSKGYGCHMMAPNWSGPVQFLPWALCQQCHPSNASAQCQVVSC